MIGSAVLESRVNKINSVKPIHAYFWHIFRIMFYYNNLQILCLINLFNILDFPLQSHLTVRRFESFYSNKAD